MSSRFFRLPLAAMLFAALLSPVARGAETLPRSTPEAEGISSQAILGFLDAVDAPPHEMHSFILIRHGKVVAEGWWGPYRPELKHTLYSLSKSFTSTAIGFAVSEGRLSVDDKVLSFFPDKAPAEVSEHLAALRVRDLLSMTVGQNPDPTGAVNGSTDDWVQGFLATPIENEPGTVFLYNSMATYVCSAIVTKLTGETVEDYLTPRLFEPLGIADHDWETCPEGNNTGGWGLRLRTEGIAKFAQLYLQKGMWDGAQLVPAAWVEEATTAKIMQSPEVPAERRATNDWLQGYCYQFWRCKTDCYRGDGAFGQYAIVMPEQDAVIAITSETSNMQGIMNGVWEHLQPAMQARALPEDTAGHGKLQERIAGLKHEAPAPSASTLAEKVLGAHYSFAANDDGLSKLSISGGDFYGVEMTYGDATYKIPFGGGNWVFSETGRPCQHLTTRARNNLEGLPPFKTAGAYAWKDANTLELTLRYIESPHTETIICVFDGDKIEVRRSVSFARNAETVAKGVRE